MKLKKSTSKFSDKLLTNKLSSDKLDQIRGGSKRPSMTSYSNITL